MLKVPLDSANPPRLLEVEALAPGRDEGAQLQLLANGVELWRQQIPNDGWSKTFSLEEVPMNDELRLEIKSDTFTPAEEYQGSTDDRSLGVVVTGIRLTARDSF